ncbi:hypothetical protein MATL_G00221180 [Megalops atlanticus]|uniref:Uncharacterized protein n=1 Tax=Megalops atlanticus TaxID=7932 RepID=A0A9D3SWV3_MEGAT|nr:hypothetical protein MATL_G00221180 [Megalops atlanticus]
MSNGVVFRSQLASIMEVLANAAVEEICKIVDDGYAILHLEMSEYQKENESLKMKLHMMELKVAQGCTDGISMPESSLTAGFDGLRDHPRGASKERAVPAANRVFGHSAGGNLSNPLSVLGEDISLQPVIVKQDESADLEEGKTVLIKEEKPEEDNGALSVLKISDEALLTGAGGPGAGGEEWVAAANPGIASSQRTEDPTTQRRSRHGAWECADMDKGRTDMKEERLEGMKISEERPGKWDAVSSQTLPDSLSDHSLPPAVKSAGNSQPAFPYPSVTLDPLATDSSPAEVEAEAEMPTAWSEDAGSGRIQMQHGHYNEGREREPAQPDSVGVSQRSLTELNHTSSTLTLPGAEGSTVERR